MILRNSAWIAALGAVLALEGCGGGASSGSPALPHVSASQAPTTQALTQTFTVTIPLVPSTSAVIRQPKDASPNTGSIAIAVQSVNGAASSLAPIVAKLGAGAPGCTSNTASIVCTVAAPAAVGVDVFSVSTYASTNATGSVLASTNVAATVGSSGGVSTIPLTLGGIPAKVAFAPAFLPLVNDGAIHHFAVTLDALDASGATIVGATPYASTVSLQIANDPTHALSLSTAAVTQPGTIVTVTFDGSKQLSNATIQASATSVAPATLAAAPLNVTPAPLVVFDDQVGATATLSEAGFTGTFTASVANAQDASVSIAAGGLQSGSTVATIVPKTTFDITTLNVGNGVYSYGVPLAIVPDVGTYAVASPARLWVDAGNTIEGPDGKLWTGDGNAGTITSFDPATGAVNTTTVSSTTDLTGQGKGIMAIAFDQSGNIWFGDAGQIGEFTPSTGNVQLFTTGLEPNADITAIIAGPPGSNAMWFYDQGGNPRLQNATQPTYFGSINTTSGAITEYQTPNGAAPNSAVRALSMILGPDGAIWFTDGKNEAIGRLDPSSGSFSEYSTDAPNPPNQAPVQLVNGPDGNIWFTATNMPSVLVAFNPTSTIGSIAPSSKQVQLTTLPFNWPPTALTVGSDHNLWFAQTGPTLLPALGVFNVSSRSAFAYAAKIPEDARIGTILDRGDRTLWLLDYGFGDIGKVPVK